MSVPNKLTLSQIETIGGVSSFISVLSFLGSIFIVLCYIKFTHLRKFAFTLVAWLSLSDIGNQLSDFVQPSASSILEMEAGTKDISGSCYVQAIGDSFFELASVLWTTAIAATLHLTVFRRMNPTDLQSKLFLFMCVCFGLPLVLTLSAAADRALGPAGGWCWIIDSKQYWRYICFYIPMWIAVIFNTVVYVRVLRLLKSTVKTSGEDETTKKIKSLMNKLQLYPFILIIVWLFPSVNRIRESLTGGDQKYSLFMLQKVFSSSQGLLNAFAYGFSGGVREAIRDYISSTKIGKKMGILPSSVVNNNKSGGGGDGDGDNIETIGNQKQRLDIVTSSQDLRPLPVAGAAGLQYTQEEGTYSENSTNKFNNNLPVGGTAAW